MREDDEAEHRRQRARVAGAEPVDPAREGVGDRALLDVEGELAGAFRLGQRPGVDVGLGSVGRHGGPLRCSRSAVAGARPMSPLRPDVMSSTIWVVLVSVGLDLGGHPAQVERRDAIGDLHDVVHVVARSARRRGPGRPAAGPGRGPAGSGPHRGRRSARRGRPPCCSRAPPWRWRRSGADHRRGWPPADAPTTRCAPTGSPSVSRACFSISPSVEERVRPTDLATEEHVLGDVEVVGQGEVLVDELDPECGGRARVVRSSTGLPSKAISPLSMLWMPAKHLTSVDLPAPLSPTSAVTSPG